MSERIKSVGLFIIVTALLIGLIQVPSGVFGGWLDDLGTKKDGIAALKDSLTVVILFGGAAWGLIQFRAFRQLEESVAIGIDVGHVVTDDGHLVVYTEVVVQNIGKIKIRGKSFQVTATAYDGATTTGSQEWNRGLDGADPHHLNLIDNGEFVVATFTHDFGAIPATALFVSAMFTSRRLLQRNEHLSWTRETIKVLRGVVGDDSGGGGGGSSGR